MLTPREIVESLDRYIIGQGEAKRAVAVALRNRYRRSRLKPELREEITPKNIIMMGPTGVGKTEIARRLAKLVDAPLVKVEATKFTEVGYVGRDVDSMIRDLVEASIRLCKDKRMAAVRIVAETAANERLIDLLVPGAGELMGGSQRETRLDKLTERMDALHISKDAMYWYVNLRKFGGCTHSGFGMGFERLLIYLTGVDNIRMRARR